LQEALTDSNLRGSLWVKEPLLYILFFLQMISFYVEQQHYRRLKQFTLSFMISVNNQAKPPTSTNLQFSLATMSLTR
jgi:hypothetical protein